MDPPVDPQPFDRGGGQDPNISPPNIGTWQQKMLTRVQRIPGMTFSTQPGTIQDQSSQPETNPDRNQPIATSSLQWFSQCNVVVDVYSKHIEAWPLRNQASKLIVEGSF